MTGRVADENEFFKLSKTFFPFWFQKIRTVENSSLAIRYEFPTKERFLAWDLKIPTSQVVFSIKHIPFGTPCFEN